MRRSVRIGCHARVMMKQFRVESWNGAFDSQLSTQPPSMQPSPRHQERRIDAQVSNYRVPDVLDRRVEHASRGERRGQPRALHHFLLELARSPAGVAEAETVLVGPPAEDGLDAVARPAQ